MTDERIWLTYPESGGFFHCPKAAVGDWKLLGWVESEPPPEPVSPVIAERVAWEAEQQRLADEAAAQTAPKSTKSARRGESEE